MHRHDPAVACHPISAQIPNSVRYKNGMGRYGKLSSHSRGCHLFLHRISHMANSVQNLNGPVACRRGGRADARADRPPVEPEHGLVWQNQRCPVVVGRSAAEEALARHAAQSKDRALSANASALQR
jgi:hypothetical protein